MASMDRRADAKNQALQLIDEITTHIGLIKERLEKDQGGGHRIGHLALQEMTDLLDRLVRIDAIDGSTS